jgi:uncharacterized protein with HEPN domain
MSRDDEIILDLVNALNRVMVFSREMSRSDFFGDEKTQ